MGMDFIAKTKRSMRKGWDNARVQLCERTLFSTVPEEIRRNSLADLTESAALVAGDHVIVQQYRGRLTAFHGLSPVAHFRLGPDLEREVARLEGCLDGVVTEIHPLSRTVSIALVAHAP
jgi:hypothetical protein